jgi:hypothetical protein
LWVNGVSVASASGNTNNISSDTIWIGRNAFSGVASDTWFAGYMSNVRIVKGVAVYTGAFSPPVMALQSTQTAGINIAAITGTQTSLLIQQSNRFVDNSSIGATIKTLNSWPSIQPFAPFAPQFQYTQSVIGGSAYFDGTGDYLTLPNNATTTIGSSDYTFEGWFYTPAVSALQTLYTYGSGSGGFRVFFNLTNLWFLNGATTIFQPTSVIRANEWIHVALVRSGSGTNNTAVWINGTRAAQQTNTTSFVAAPPQLGMEGTSSSPYTGYMSSVRLVKSALYNPADASIAIPTAPFTNSSSPAFLLNFTNGGIIDGTMDNVLETVGNAQVSTSVVKYGSGSLAFDGSGDYLLAPSSPAFDVGSGDFTIECWVYPTTWNATAVGIFSKRPTVVSANQIGLEFSGSTGIIRFAYSNAGSEVIIAGATGTLNTWQHIAAVRNRNTLTIYQNGVSTATATISVAIATNTGSLAVGAVAADGSFPLTGYIDDFRITKGVARYLSNFLPPQVALPRQ